MLDNKDAHDTRDTDVVKAWLTVAFEPTPQDPKTGLAARLAIACKVSKQAVTGWRKTGRISKTNLEAAIAFLGSAPTFGSAEPAGTYAIADWPFRKFTRARLERLPADERAKIESHALFVITEWERSRGQSDVGEAAA